MKDLWAIRCSQDNWLDEVKECFQAADSSDDLRLCHQKLSTEQRESRSKAMMAAAQAHTE